MVTSSSLLSVTLVLVLAITLYSVGRLLRNGHVLQWRIASSAVVATFLATVAPTLLSKLVGEQQTFTSAIGETVTLYGPLYDRARAGFSFLLVLVTVVSAFAVFRKRRPDAGIRNNKPLAAILLVIVGTVAGTIGTSGLNLPPYYLAISALLIVMLCQQNNPRDIAVGLALVIQFSAIASSVAGLLGLSGTISACRDDKCGITGTLFSGVMSHENSLGLFMLMALPIILLLEDKRLRNALGIVIIMLVVASGSRSSSIALAAVLAVIGLHFLGSRWTLHWLLWKTCILFVSFAGLAVSAYLSFGGWNDPRGFTGRVRLWELALDVAVSSPLIGVGMHGWSSLRSGAAFGAAAIYSPHSQLLDVLLLGGVLSFTGFVMILVLWMSRAWRGDLPSGAFVAAISWAGILERPVSFGVPDWGSLALLTGMLLLATPSVVGFPHPIGGERRYILNYRAKIR